MQIDDAELERLAVTWQRQALRGDRKANGIARALEVERRRHVRACQVPVLPVRKVTARRWWQLRVSALSGRVPGARELTDAASCSRATPRRVACPTVPGDEGPPRSQ